jgi:hypothetical protein
MAGPCDHGNESLGSVKCWEISSVAEQLIVPKEEPSFMALVTSVKQRR